VKAAESTTSSAGMDCVDFRLTRYHARGWRATFFVTDIEHSLMSDTASAWSQRPGGRCRVAAREALRKVE
jgi:hypothetical protein